MTKLLIGVCAWYNPPFQCVDALWRLEKPEGIDKIEIYYSQSYNTFLCRNDIVKKAQEENYDYILFVDADNIFYNKKTLIKLYNSMQKTENAYIMAGVYKLNIKSKSKSTFLTIAKEPEDLKSVFIEEEDLDKKIFKCQGIGFGCVLVKTELFNNIEKPYFEWIDPNPTNFVGDDIYWSCKVRDAGFTIYMDTDIQVGHLKQIMI